jgi:carboxylesterase
MTELSPAGQARVLPGCEPFSFEGGPAGILMLHGFTGNPASLRRIGEWLAARGHAVSAPLYPGHGTHWRDLARSRWQDWVGEAERALLDLATRCQGVIAFGLSGGAAVALHLGARHPDVVRGVAVVNPWVRDRRIAIAPFIWPVVRSRKGVGNDIKKPGEDELPYERIPVRAIAEFTRFHRLLREELPRMRLPLLAFHAPEDHVVPEGTVEWLLERVGSEDKELVMLPNCYHVATLDHDAELIFERTHEFVETHAVPHGAPG